MLTRLEDKYPLVEIILTLGSTVLASLPLITHTFLCLLFLTTWVERLDPDLQNMAHKILKILKILIKHASAYLIFVTFYTDTF